MKKILLAAALLAGSATAASAQTTVVKVNVLSPLVKTGSFFVEHRLSEHSSVQLGGLFTRWNGLSGGDAGDTRLSGFALTPEYRLYLSDNKTALHGFYVGPFLRYQQLALTNEYQSQYDQGNPVMEQTRATLSTFGGGVVVGHQWLFRERFSLDAFLGPSFSGSKIRVRDSSPNANTDFDTDSYKGFGLRAGLTFGVAF